MAERDPRIHPMPGDQIRKAKETRTVTDYDPDTLDKHVVFCRTEKHFVTKYKMPYLGQWRKWASKAEVIHAAD